MKKTWKKKWFAHLFLLDSISTMICWVITVKKTALCLGLCCITGLMTCCWFNLWAVKWEKINETCFKLCYTSSFHWECQQKLVLGSAAVVAFDVVAAELMTFSLVLWRVSEYHVQTLHWTMWCVAIKLVLHLVQSFWHKTYFIQSAHFPIGW